VNETILVVDDEQEMRNLLRVCLQRDGFRVTPCSSGAEALQAIQEGAFDLMILDIMMPELDGFDVLQWLQKGTGKHLPVVILTALGDTDSVVKGLNAGADDYVVKPFEPRELTARMTSVLRRSAFAKDHIKENDATRHIHGLRLETEQYRLFYDDTAIPLTKKEFQIFKRMALHPGRIYTREQLLELEWDMNYTSDPRTVDAHIKRIREKLHQYDFHKPIIETVWGIGYQIIED
jgi:two-component system, OmpR family, response regulator ResD